jgi:hypothetical protein
MAPRCGQKKRPVWHERTGRALFEMPAGIFIAIDAAMIALAE